jgi:hypothetical protein
VVWRHARWAVGATVSGERLAKPDRHQLQPEGPLDMPAVSRYAFEGFSARTTRLLFNQQAFRGWDEPAAVGDSPMRHRRNVLAADWA